MAPAKKSWQKRVWLAVRWLVTVGALAYVITQIDWYDRLVVDGTTIRGHVEHRRRGMVFHAEDGRVLPVANEGAGTILVEGFWTLLKGLDLSLFLAALAAYPVTILLMALRWQWLLRTCALDPGFRESLRLTWIGLLFNNVFPGATGGDFVKGWCIFRRTPGKRMMAVVTVFMDRALGLVSLMLVGAVALWSQSMRPELRGPAQFVAWSLLAVLIGGVVFFSGRVRRLLRISEIVARMPFHRQLRLVDESVFHYRRHIGAMTRCVALSLPVHLWTIGCIYLLGRALGMTVAPVNYYIFLPVIFTGSAFFPSIAGLGVMEGLFQQLFTLAGATSSSAVALCILYRVMILIGSVPGGWPTYREFSLQGIRMLTDSTAGGALTDSPASSAT